MIEILLIDDQNIILEGIKALLNPKTEFKIVGTARNGDIGIQLVSQLKPDIAIVDIEMPGINGITLTQKISQDFPLTKVIVLSSHDDDKYLAKALEAGASEYLNKNILREDLENTIWKVYRNSTQLEPNISEKYLELKPHITHPIFFKHSKWWITGFAIFSFLSILIISIIRTFNIFPVQANSTSPTETVKKPEIKIVSALGRIEPQSKVIKISPSPDVGGNKIAKLLIKEGEQVSAGQTIAILDNFNNVRSELVLAQENVKVAQANLTIVKAGAKDGEIKAKASALKRIQAQLEQEVVADNAQVAQLRAQLRTETQEKQSRVARLRAELNNAQSEFTRYEKLAKDGVISDSDLDTRILKISTSQQALAEAQANVNKTIDTLQEQIKQTLAIALKNKNTLEEQVIEAEANFETISEVRDVDIAEARAKIEREIAALKQVEEKLKLTYVKAPTDGTILKINAYPGELVNQEESLVEFAQTNKMMIVGEVYESDISKIKVGQLAKIRSQTGSFDGEITGKVSQIGLKISQQKVFDTDPTADIDSRIIEVKIKLDDATSKRVANLIESKTIIKINI